MAAYFVRLGNKFVNIGDGNITHVVPASHPAESLIGFTSGEYVSVEGIPQIIVRKLTSG